MKNRLLKTQVRQSDENLFVITPSAYFPFPNSYYMRHLFNLKLLRDIRIIFRQLEVKDFIVWFNLLNFSTVLPNLKNKKIVFDMSDDIPLFFQLKGKQGLYRTQMRLLKKAYKYASIPVVSAKKIKEKYQKFSENEIIVIPNGHGYSTFRKNDVPVPADMKDIPEPRIGFLGTLFIFTDDQLLEHLISKRPEYQYIFVGKVQKEFPIERISRYKNVHLLGEKKKEEVGAYLEAMDICINPFKRHEVNDSVSPLKVYEYLAFSKPVVSTFMYSLQQENVSKHIHFCESADSFLDTLDHLVRGQDYQNPISEKELLENHWESLFNRLLGEMKNQYGFEL